MLTSTVDLGSSDLPGDLVLAHPDVIRCYYRDIDPTLIRENLKLTPIERLRKLEEFVSFLMELREAKFRGCKAESADNASDANSF